MSNHSSDFAKPPPAKNSESSRAESRIAFRPLAPKAPDPTPRPAVARTQSTPLGKGFFAFKRQSDRCQVCFKLHCHLVSHKNYGTTSRGSNTGLPNQPPKSSIPSDPNFVASYAYRLAQDFDLNISSAPQWEPQYDLPLPAELNTTAVYKLFHHWFTSQFSENFAVPRPSHMSSDLLHSPLLAPSLLDTTLCLSILGVAAAYQSTDMDPSKNVAALTFMGQAMEHMRERISENPSFISDTTVAAGALLWAANWYLGDPETMKQHGANVCAFIKTRGGIEHLGLSGAVERVVRWADILNSLLLRTACSFPVPSNLSSLPQNSADGQGLFWYQRHAEDVLEIDLSLIKGYKDTCKLIEIVERLDQNEPSYKAYYNVCQQVQALFVRNASLQERYQDTGDMNECFTLALYIIKLRFFWNIQRQQQSLLRSNAAMLVRSIKTAGRPSFWQKNLTILVWLLFVTELAQEDFPGRDWARQILGESLETKFGDTEDWKEDWRESLSNDLRHLCWSRSRFGSMYDGTCKDVVKELKEMDDD